MSTAQRSRKPARAGSEMAPPFLLHVTITIAPLIHIRPAAVRLYMARARLG